MTKLRSLLVEEKIVAIEPGKIKSRLQKAQAVAVKSEEVALTKKYKGKRVRVPKLNGNADGVVDRVLIGYIPGSQHYGDLQIVFKFKDGGAATLDNDNGSILVY